MLVFTQTTFIFIMLTEERLYIESTTLFSRLTTRRTPDPSRMIPDSHVNFL